ncbi:teashirt homolog 2 isoform X1 [Chiloscyllium plagiosum]|uniref:teashirt homolog 2 isoform X1 n=2 Tax=Chiloscyllium plagiosum TaxID=36176 RepID=UPI001CB88A9C|nr:teashirt homolog 2 isoform X1 [Chiloscyllium plagiosum]XP_043566156.1 teashirt homolog 2 isoform X1 [Chiloscyllium plagiosum]XP_043566157.1 teashirt homolog 2 isoform X1 [Chiloscyllium plagiosum]XP_043566158.1 teashirt homolog 2 isoform X1 [Chiloscyllium plagiosum]
MPRRKQQAPKRAAVYVPDEDLKTGELREREDASPSAAELQGNGYMCTEEEEEEEEESKGSYSYQNSPVSAMSNQDAECESHLSDTSDRLADFKSISSRDGQEKEEQSNGEIKNGQQNSLGAMRAVYASFLSDSYWSSLGFDLKQSKTERTSCKSSNESTKSSFDWHQDALSKTFQQTSSGRPVPKPNLFSSVQLYRQNNKLFGTVFTGASRFRCRECSAAYDTLVELTVHMNDSGHYQDDNHEKDVDRNSSWTKTRKRALQDIDGMHDAQKVLKCMYCGHSFDSLQDLSVHMIKTKHYQKVPLKEPMPPIGSKLVPPTKKRAQHEVNQPCSPDSTTGVAGTFAGEAQKNSNPYVSSNNRYGYQNGASYTWQFEACKSQILKCMECGSSHDTLQQLTAHMMVTGHFLKVTNSASKKGKQIVFDPLAVDKAQSVTEGPSNETQPLAPVSKLPPDSLTPSVSEDNKTHEEKQEISEDMEKQQKDKDDCKDDNLEKIFDPTLQYQYIREEDLEESSKGGGDILKSLENTVTSAINKAQTGSPSWSAYPSIHAAYQLPGIIKPVQLGTQILQVKPNLKPIAPKVRYFSVITSNQNQPLQSNNDQIKEEPISPSHEQLSSKLEESNIEKKDPKLSLQSGVISPCKMECESPIKTEILPDQPRTHSPCLKDADEAKERFKKEPVKNDTGSPNFSMTNGCSGMTVITDHPSEQLSVSPLSALQSIMNTHLGKAAKPLNSNSDPVTMLCRLNKSLLEKSASPPSLVKPSNLADRYYYESSDQPIDLTKSKSDKAAQSNPVKPFTSLPSKHALSDIADMVKVLPKGTTPKPSTSSKMTAERLETDVRSFEDVSMEFLPVQKRKGRQSNWNPQHLLILQAQFAASLWQTGEGKYLLSDLGPQDRMHISKFTGLTMTTISHWLANVKYQLRKTGGTKFLKNLDTGHPIFYCNDCASQFRTPSTYIGHLESHLGFTMKDMAKISVQHARGDQEVSKVTPEKSAGPLVTDEDTGSKFQCNLCNRTFASKHAVKLHLSKTHGKSPENHSQYVTELEEE